MTIIRPARAADAPILAALSVETWLGTYIRAGLGPVRARYVLREFSPEAMLQAIDTEQVMVSEQAKGITGYSRARHGQTAPITGCHGTELVTFYVRPAMQRQGIGRALLSNLVSQAQSQESPTLWLTVNAKNKRGQAFYASHGFAVAGQTDFVLDGNRYPNFLLRRDLSRAG